MTRHDILIEVYADLHDLSVDDARFVRATQRLVLWGARVAAVLVMLTVIVVIWWDQAWRVGVLALLGSATGLCLFAIYDIRELRRRQKTSRHLRCEGT